MRIPDFSSLAALLCAGLLSVGLSGCAGGNRVEVEENAAKAGLIRRDLAAGPFTLASWQRPGQGDTMTVYIEGDGLAWITPRQPARDPTPRNPVSLALATRDTGPGPVLYIARPCQYRADPAACQVRYWTNARFSPEVVEATDQAITQANSRFGTHHIRLVGYSGGGVLAALLAARRDDVTALVTIAAPLDTDAWIARHAVSPMSGSLAPLDHPGRWPLIPQLHLVGEKDTVVPPNLNAGIPERLQAACAVVRVIPGYAHDSDWQSIWPLWPDCP